MKRKKFTYILVLMVTLSLLIISWEGVSADLKKPVWHKGDFWNYDISLVIPNWNLTISGTEIINVEGTKTITIDYSQYKARMVTVTREISTVYLGTPIDMSADEIKYYGENDFSLMKVITDSSLYGHAEGVYSYPFVGMDYPITVGKSWERDMKLMVTDSSGTTTLYDRFYYECTSETDVNTPSGLFSCYIVKSYLGGVGLNNYSLWYLSPETGYNPVMEEEYENGTLMMSKKLTSFKYETSITGDGDTNGETSSTPGFEFIFLIVAMAILFFWKYKKYCCCSDKRD